MTDAKLLFLGRLVFLSLLALSIKRIPKKEPVYYPTGIEDNFRYTRIENNEFKLELKNPITLTGSSLDTIFEIPFYHKVLDVIIHHVDSSGSDSNDSLDLDLYREIIGDWKKFFHRSGSKTSHFFLDEINFKGAGRYKITANSTSTDQLKINISLEIIHP